STEGKNWRTFSEYDPAGRLVLRAHPSAIHNDNPSRPDLLDKSTSGYAHLHDDKGLIETFSYHASGVAFGLLNEHALKNGEADNSPVKQSVTTYVEATLNDVTVALVDKVTEGDGTATRVTDFDYVVTGGRITQLTTGLPDGSQTVAIYDEMGRVHDLIDGDNHT